MRKASGGGCYVDTKRMNAMEKLLDEKKNSIDTGSFNCG